MAITNFIPELWSASLLELWWDQAVFAALVNREYEGEATKGNVVHISGIVAPTVKDYKAAGRTTSPDDISDTGIDLLIDQEKSFDFLVDDIDRVQAAGSLESYTGAAAEGLTADSEEFLANLMVDGGTAYDGDTTVATDAEDAWNVIADIRKQMNKAKVPSANRVLSVNAEFERLLLGNDAKLTNVDTSGDTAGLRDATLGKILGFRTVVTNYLPELDEPQAVAFQQRCVAYVSQIQDTEGMRAQNTFADRVRGLHVYGGKVIRPLGVVVYGGGS